MKTAIKQKRAEELPEQNKDRLSKVKTGMKRKREQELPEQTKDRLSKVKTDMREYRSKRQRLVPDHDNVILDFLQKVKQAADYVCCSCHRLMYRRSVVHFNQCGYQKAPVNLVNNILTCRIVSSDGNEWICNTCHLTLKRGNMPAQSNCNKMVLVAQPQELKDLNSLELRLISQRIPFMKMVGLPRGRQHGIHGPAVNVPSKLDFVCEQFPRLPSESQIVPMKLKRRMAYKSHYLYDYVRPEKVLAALRWLKVHNPLYADIVINEHWREDSKCDDEELWHAMTSDCPHKIIVDNLTNSQSAPDIVQNKEVMLMEEHVDENMKKLADMAKEKNLSIVDVPRDGNCLFASVCYQLDKCNLFNGTPAELRVKLAKFMKENPKCTRDGSHYRDFLSARVDRNGMFNADTEQPDDEDMAIAHVDDLETQKELRWVRYLDNLELGLQWGEHLAVQALSEMFQVTIHIIATEHPNMQPIRPIQGEGILELHLGLIQQFHYVALTDAKSQEHEERNSDCNKTPHVNSSAELSDNELSGEDTDDEMTAEDNDAFEKASKTSGLPYETSLFKRNPDLGDKQITCAPGEGEKPLPLLTDKHFEQLSNPDKYPDGENGLLTEREKQIDVRRYFNQRLLDVDGRFAKSPEYLLCAQYATESRQVHGNINHFVFRRLSATQQNGQKLTAAFVKDAENMRQLVRTDQAYKILKNVRGSPAYFQSVFYDVLAMVRQLGIPTWFFTVSAADMQWPDLLQTIARQYGTTLSDDDVKQMPLDAKYRWLRCNPVTAARHFQYRLELLFKTVLKSKAHPLGELVDYVMRIEFQARGSPHAHTLLWIKDAPKLDVQTDKEVCDFVSQHLSCSIPPDDKVLADLATNLQKHNHSAYCRKKGSCRFRFPRPPSRETLLAREPVEEIDSAEIKNNAKTVLNAVYQVLTHKDTPPDLSLQQLLEKAGVNSDDYDRALSISEKGNTLVLKRNVPEQCINPYNPTILKAWQANMDLQFILDAYACVMYVASYMTKDEKGMGELLKQVSKECGNQDIRAKLRQLGSVFLNHREVSAQEATYRILSMPMKRLSRSVIFVNTDPKAERGAVLKPAKEIENKDADDEDIFQSNIIVRYGSRPDCLEDMCLASFAANYSVSTTDYADEIDDSAPGVLDDGTDDIEGGDRDALPARIQLKNRTGKMHKRKREAVIRFRKYNEEKENTKFYHAKLMLYTPWRDEETDLLAGYPDYATHYHAIAEQILEMEAKYTENVDLIDRAIEENAIHGPPEHAWPDVAPGTEHDQMQDQQERIQVETELEQEDLDANAAMFQNPAQDRSGELIARYEALNDKELLAPADYREMMRCLNEKQKDIVFYHRQWCKESVIAMRQNEQVKPYRIFLSGPGGVGKSHVIKLIHSDTRRLLPLSNKIQPTDVTTLLTAPTGVAAFNIDGMTVHSALLLRTTKYGKDGAQLAFEKLNTLRCKLGNLYLIIIDEVSMVGSDMLLNIHRRLDEIKGVNGEGIFFGNVSVLAVGDLYQLPPVMQKAIFQPVNDPMARLHGSIWKDEFNLHELDEIMRQKDDSSFAELLNRVRMAQHTAQDIETLKAREINADDVNYPKDVLHVFAYNADVDRHNSEQLNRLAPKDQQVSIHASDDKTDSTGQLQLSKVAKLQKRSETGGLETILVLAVGARVMMTVNVNTADGLVNGVMGTVQAIIQDNSGKVNAILVKFDNAKVGHDAVASSQWKNQYPNGVPVVRYEGRYEKAGKKGAQISRRQFPLTLAWSVTIHKCQGLTLETIVVSMKGAKKFGPGQAYVAFSRVKCLRGLHIINFDKAGIKADKRIEQEMSEMRQKSLPALTKPRFLNFSTPQWITVGHLNVRYFLEKVKDMTSASEQSIYAATDVMCFTETYLTSNHNIDNFLAINNYVQFRQDVPSEHDHQGEHGIMICACAKLEPMEQDLVVHGLESKVVIIQTERSALLVATIYRRPSLSMTAFLTLLDQLLKMMPLTIPTVVIGDFNDDLQLQNESRLVTFMQKYGFKQHVTRPTTDSGSLLDHAYFNMNYADTMVDVHDIYYSDHDAVFLSIKVP